MARCLLMLLLLTAPKPPTRSGLPQLDDTRRQVLASWGQPATVYSYGIEAIYPSSRREQLVAVGPVADIYKRDYSGGSYQIRVRYQRDRDPFRGTGERVEWIEFYLPNGQTFENAVAAIPQVTAMCATGCSLLRVTDPIRSTMLLYPKAVSAEQLHHLAVLAGDLATPAMSRWVPCFEDKPAAPEARLGDPESRFHRVILQVCQPAFEKTMGKAAEEDLPNHP